MDNDLNSSEAPNFHEHDADFAVLMRRYLMSLQHARRHHWVCVCQKCSRFSLKLSLPKRNNDLKAVADFEVFFVVQSMATHALQEARITIKDLRNNTLRWASEPAISSKADIARICQNITEFLGHCNYIHLVLEDGIFQRLCLQPKAFDSDWMSRTVSLTALFNRQHELLRGRSVLPVKKKRVLAVILASALLPFLESPWLQFFFNHSMTQFVELRLGGGLPDITTPLLALKHLPTLSTRTADTKQTSDALRDITHPNASVLALRVLLCEPQYCTSVELMAKNPQVSRNFTDDLYTCLDQLRAIETNAGVDYYLATKGCLTGDYYPIGEDARFEDVSFHRLFYQNAVKQLKPELFKSWGIRLENLGSFDTEQKESCWGSAAREAVRLNTDQPDSSSVNVTARATTQSSLSDSPPVSHASPQSDLILPASTQTHELQVRGRTFAFPERSLHFFDASHQSGSGQIDPLSEKWMDILLSSIYRYVDPALDLAEPVRIAILDSGFDPEHPSVIQDRLSANPSIKGARSFVHGTKIDDIKDEIGHSTHGLGLLLNVSPFAEIYVARVTRQETLDPNTYDDIAKAIDYAVTQWKVDIISMSFGIREYHEVMTTAVSNALNKRTLLFAEASDDGANLGRTFPARYPGVFCINSTDGEGNPSSFNPTASETDVNFSLLGQNVISHWPAGLRGHNETVRAMSGTSVATPIAAGLAASVMYFVRQQDQQIIEESERLGSWLKHYNSMEAVFKCMVRQRRCVGYDYITPAMLFDIGSSKEEAYSRIKAIKRNIYKY